MTTRILDALAHVDEEKHDFALALDWLIDAWRETRAIEIAEVVEVVDAALDLPPFTGLSGETRTTWTIAAKDSNVAVTAAAVAERGPLIRAIAGMTTSMIANALNVVETWDDPRVSTVVIGLLKELRYSGTTSRPFWHQVFAHIPAYRDPRYARLLNTLPQTWRVGPSMQTWLTNRLTEVATFDSATRLSEADTTALDRIRAIARAVIDARTRGSTLGGHTSAVSEQSLLADIYANPDDDAPRLVYADWLLERGNPRGEFISLQLRSEQDKDREAKRREKELLKTHKKEWLGQLANVLGGDIEFHRGFLRRVHAKFRHQRDVEQYGSLNDWLTLEEIEWGTSFVRSDQLEWSRWMGPQMRNVRIAYKPSIKGILAATKQALDAHKGDEAKIKPWELRELTPWNSGLTKETFKQLLDSPLLANLEVIDLSGISADPSWCAELARCPSEVQLSMVPSDPRLYDWQKALQRTRAQTITLRDWEVHYLRFSRSKSPRSGEQENGGGGFTDLLLEMRPRQKIKSIHPLPSTALGAKANLRGLRPRSLTSFKAVIELKDELVDVTDAFMDVAKLLLVIR